MTLNRPLYFNNYRAPAVLLSITLRFDPPRTYFDGLIP